MRALVMTTVLLPGLASSDGGGVGRADVGAVCVDFGGEWEGTWRRRNQLPAPITLTGGVLEVDSLFRFPCVLVPQGPGTVEVRFGSMIGGWGEVTRLQSSLGIYRVADQEVRICYSCRSGKTPASFHPGPHEELLILRHPKAKK